LYKEDKENRGIYRFYEICGLPPEKWTESQAHDKSKERKT
jgi:hypothetical protein